MLNRRSAVTFDLSLMLLLVEINLVTEEQSRKGYLLSARDTDHVEMILALLIEVVALHMGTPIVQVGVPGPEGSILGGGICLARFLALNKQF